MLEKKMKSFDTFFLMSQFFSRDFFIKCKEPNETKK